MGLAKKLGTNPRELATKHSPPPPPLCPGGHRRSRWRSRGPGSSTSPSSPTPWRTWSRPWTTRRSASSRPRPSTPSSSTSARSTWPNRCTWGTCARRSSARRSPTCSSVWEARSIRQNHLGDWGLPIALVLYHLKQRASIWTTLTLHGRTRHRAIARPAFEIKGDIRGLAAALEHHAGPHRIIELEEQNAGAQADAGSRQGDARAASAGRPQLLTDWHKLIDCTMHAVYESLELLGVDLGPSTTAANRSIAIASAPPSTRSCVSEGLAVEDHGALVVKFDDRERPLLIRKSDGGYLYATTDLAAVKLSRERAGFGPDPTSSTPDSATTSRMSSTPIRLIGWDRTDGRRDRDPQPHRVRLGAGR